MLIALVLSLVVLTLRKVNLAFSIALITGVYGILTLGWRAVEVTYAAFNVELAELVAAFALASLLAALLREARISDNIIDGLNSIDSRLTSLATPALVGLIPVPGGALISAVMLRDHFNSMGLSPERAAFINYWFRHIWVPSWPLHQPVILAAAILSLKVIEVVEVTYVGTIAATLSGLLIVSSWLRKGGGAKASRVRDVVHVWPFVLIVVLAVMFRLGVVETLLATIASILATYRPGRRALVNSVKFALNPTILGAVLAIMVFKEYVVASGVASDLASSVLSLALPPEALAFAIPFAVSAALTNEFLFVGITFPLLLPLMNSRTLLWAYLGGYLGVLLSPVHLCLVLTAQHFNAIIGRTYNYTIPAIALTIIITFLYTLPLG